MIFALVAGIAFGALGLVPFLHTNLLLQVFEGLFTEPIDNAVFVAALAFAHVAFEPVPALFLCIPTLTQNVSILPGHAMVLKGKGRVAFRIIMSSLLFSALAAACAAPAAFLLLPLAFDALKPFVGFALVLVAAAVFLSQGALGKAARTAVPFALAGVFGYVVLNSTLVKEPLFPILTGLFGIPALVLALPAGGAGEASKTGFAVKTAEASRGEAEVPVRLRLVAAGCVLGVASVLLPALSPALVASAVFVAMERKQENFLCLTSSIIGSRTVFELIGLAAIGKARSGYSAAISEALGKPMLHELTILVVTGLIALCVGTAIVFFLCRTLAEAAERLNSKSANAALLVLVAVALFLSSGALGVFIAAVAAAIGLLPPLLRTNRSCLMAALIIPAAYYHFT